jgi:uncharacterized SAM-binding protein YcdF (DUF218 family)
MHWKHLMQAFTAIIVALLLCSCDYLRVQTPLVKSDAIIVLAGSMKERVPSAAMLYQEGYAPLVVLANDGVFSEFSPTYNRNLYQVEWAEEELVELGVPRESIVKLPYYGSATMFDTLAAKKYLIDHGLKTIILVTSDYHTRRTYWAFRHELKDCTSAISVYPVKSSGVSMKSIVVEYFKLVYYILKYGVLGMEPAMHEITLQKT